MKDLQIHELGPLFEEVQLKNILGDGKTFPDCISKRSLEDIKNDFAREKNASDFDLKNFVDRNFSLPKAYSTGYASDSSKSVKMHIETLWNELTRTPDSEAGSLLPLPHPYIVPGGRFREIYYWDSYFTMLGLRISNRIDLIQNMVDNFSHLIDTVGYIPNGNRTYFIGRSQPPFFSLMVKLLSNGDPKVLTKYLPVLQKEHMFWMAGASLLTPSHDAEHRVVRMPDGSILNRYWDENATPRPEAYKEDLELSHRSPQKPEVLFRHIRAAAESGWDFSSRWFKNAKAFETIHTTEIIPVDLNCLLLHLEGVLAEAWKAAGDEETSKEYELRYKKRKNSILKYCWNEDKKFFFDFDFVGRTQKTFLTLASAFPLFFKIASSQQAAAVADTFKKKFLKPGGLTTTLENSGQQWDAPNGWAPLQWIAYKGLLNYEHLELAEEVSSHWLNTNLKVYEKTGKMTEKYDVWRNDGEASGGEYPNQDGFGWTNGVFLAMTEDVKLIHA
ncbi:alpha,alpha-trehalase [soil metagenome]